MDEDSCKIFGWEDVRGVQGKIAVPISAHEKPLGNGPAQWASFDDQFRGVDKNNPEAQRTALLPRPDIVIESNEKRVVETPPVPVTANATAEVSISSSVENADVYVDGKFG